MKHEGEQKIRGLVLYEILQEQTDEKNGLTARSNVIFCQCLRNLVDEIDEYVKSTHPSPEEFIRHILPEDNFEQPYTQAEQETIDRNQRNITESLKMQKNS